MPNLRALRHSRWFLTALAITTALAIIFIFIVLVGPLPNWLAPKHGASPNATQIEDLYKLLFALALVVFIGVEGSLIWFLIKFKARKGDVAAQIHGNTQLELGWTIGAAVLLIFITAVTFAKLGAIKNPEPSSIDSQGNPVASVQSASKDGSTPPPGPTLNLRVDGQQFIWRYTYPGTAAVYSYEEMVVPVGMTVKLDITSDDVAHSWWVPALGGKADAIPGYHNHTWFKILKPGVYKGQCAELCGRTHANMTAHVRALPFAEYKAWYAQQARDIQTARTLGAQGRKQFNSQQSAS